VNRLMKHIHRLAVEIGPRGSGTPEEEQAARWLVQQFKGMGYQASVHEFPTVGTFSLLQFVFLGGMLVSFLLGFIHPLPGSIAAAILLVLYILDLETKYSLSRFFARRGSQNVRAWKDQETSPQNTVILTAHYDSSRAALNFHPRMVKGFRSSFFLVFASMAAITFFLVLRSLPVWEAWDPWLVGLSVPFALYLAAVIAMLIHRELFCDYTPGANDNGSGIAVMLGVASRLAKNPIPGLHVEFLATGAEEAGTYGMLHHLSTYGWQGRTFINLDNLGTGRLFAAEAEGILRRYPADPELLRDIETVSRQAPPVEIARRDYRLLTTDATPILARGGRAVTIMACSDDGTLPNWHWKTDTLDHIEIGNLKAAEEVVYRVLSMRGGDEHDRPWRPG